MATLTNGWYKSNFPKQKITEISISITGSGTESWDGSISQDGTIVCYRSGTKVIITCNSLTAIGDMTFYDFIELKKISGLGNVTTIGADAFSYTPNLTSVDIIPENLTSIGASAFRMSSAEDGVDLSSVSTSIIGNMGTRHKRWDTSALSSVQNLTFPKTIYLDVPKQDDQRKYPDVPFVTHNGNIGYAKDYGCMSFSAYHIWNCLYSGTLKQYDNWLDWYNGTINADGMFAENNFDNQLELTMFAKLGWTYNETTRVADSQQLQTILDRLAIGFPTYVVIYTPGTSNLTHSIIINGCDAKTHKLSVVDSGMEGWLAFEDIFTAGSTDQDRIMLIDFNLPILAPNSTWFTQGATSVQKSSITEINIMDTYLPTGTVTSSWDASAAKNGSVMAYVEGTKLTLAGNGTGKIRMNADSSNIFNGFSAMASFNGSNILFSSAATTLYKAFYDCMALKTLNLSDWNTSNVETLSGTFNGMLALESINVRNWNTSNVTSMNGVFQCDVKLTELDLTDWTTDNVTDMYGLFSGINSYGGPMTLKKIIGIEKWNTQQVSNMSYIFELCPQLEVLNLTNWDVSSATTMQNMFHGCSALVSIGNITNWNTSSVTNVAYMFEDCSSLQSLDTSNWDTTSCTTLQRIFSNVTSLKKITIGEKFSFNGNGSATGNKTAAIPTPIGAAGNWYDVNGNAIAPSAIPDKTFGVYYATPAIAEEDMNQMVLVKKGNLMRTAAAIRTKTGTGKGYEPSEFADEILAI